jgi:hypothetical protein
MTIHCHWKALEEHFLMVPPLVFWFNHFQGNASRCCWCWVDMWLCILFRGQPEPNTWTHEPILKFSAILFCPLCKKEPILSSYTYSEFPWDIGSQISECFFNGRQTHRGFEEGHMMSLPSLDWSACCRCLLVGLRPMVTGLWVWSRSRSLVLCMKVTIWSWPGLFGNFSCKFDTDTNIKITLDLWSQPMA